MLLALAVGVGDKVGVLEPLRLRQHVAGHIDVVVERQHMDDVHGTFVASRCASLARALVSMTLTRRAMTSSNRLI